MTGTVAANRGMNHNKKGSFSIEIAFLFPFFLAMIFCFIWQMSLIRCEMMFKSVIIKEAEKASFLGVLSEYAPDLYSKASGKKADNDTTEFVLNEIYELSFKKQIRDHYQLLCEKNRSFLSAITNHMEFIECKTYEDSIKLTSAYTIHTPFRTFYRRFSIPLRLWDHGDHSGKLGLTGNTSVWHYDNFSRGKILRRRFGGNLPFGFPVLSGYNNGNALIIKSMDLTSETWDSPQDVQARMQESIDEMDSYRGMPIAWGEEKIIIDAEDIQKRFVKFIIPENTPMEKYSPVFTKIIHSGPQSSV